MKNTVVLNENSVEKTFRSVISFEREKAVYDVMAGTGLVPDVLGYAEKTIITQRLPGKTLGEIYGNSTEEEFFAAAEMCAKWFCNFQKIYISRTGQRLVLGDANPRNFVLHNGRLWGIDFETACPGDIVTAMGDLLAWYVDVNDLISDALMIMEKILEAEFGIDRVNRANVLARSKYYSKIHRRKLMKYIRNADCCIIAGGQSSRMGSPKGLLPFVGHKICDKIIHNMDVFDNIFISANIREYRQFGLPVMADSFTDIGPMAAIHTALTHSTKEWVMLRPCDMPLADRDVIFALFEALCEEEPGFPYANPYIAEKNNVLSDVSTQNPQAVIITDGKKPYPVLGLYHKSALPVVLKYIGNNSHRLRSLLSDLNTTYIHFAHKEKLVNLNTPQDYRRICKNKYAL